MGDTLNKFRIQAEMLSENDIEKVVKRLDKEELDKFIEILEEYNLELRERLVSVSRTLQQELWNREVLLRNVWNIVPDELKGHLIEHFDNINSIM